MHLGGLCYVLQCRLPWSHDTSIACLPRFGWMISLHACAIIGSQYLALMGNSSDGKSVITRQPLSVTTTSSSIRAAE